MSESALSIEEEAGESRALLAPDEPAPYRVYNAGGGRPILLVCDHASNFIPRALGTLGIDKSELERHIAYDIGIAEVTERLADLLDAPAVLSHFSRLIVDPNRPVGDPTQIPSISDGTIIPANRNLGLEERDRRLATFFQPYHAEIDHHLEAFAARGVQPAFVSMHSFTPFIRGQRRPWDVGILWNEKDGRLPLPLMERFGARGLVIGDNEPYSGADGHGCTVHRHAEPRGLANVLIELRQDLIDTETERRRWADMLAAEIRAVLDETDLSAVERA